MCSIADFILRFFIQINLIFDQNFCATKNRFFNERFGFLTKISIFVQKYRFFYERFGFLTKITIFVQKIHLWWKLRFLMKIMIFDENYDFWPKLQFYPTFRLLTKDFLQKILIKKISNQKFKKSFRNRRLSQILTKLKRPNIVYRN